MSAHHPAARNSCNRTRNTTKKTARKEKPPEPHPQNQAFMAISPENFFGIGRSIVCEKKAIAYARSYRENDDGKSKPGVTVGIIREGVCVFAEGPHAKHFLSQNKVELN